MATLEQLCAIDRAITTVSQEEGPGAIVNALQELRCAFGAGGSGPMGATGASGATGPCCGITGPTGIGITGPSGASGTDTGIPSQLSVPNTTTLQAIDVVALGLVDGQRAWVESLKDLFRYDPSSTATPDGIVIVDATGPGNWLRELVADRAWQFVTDWWIDPQSAQGPASDENPGTSAAFPLATFAEFLRRVTGATNVWTYQGTVPVTVRWNSSSTTPNSDPILLDYRTTNDQTLMLTYGTLTSVDGLTYTVVTKVLDDPTTNTVEHFTFDQVTTTDMFLYDPTPGTEDVALVIEGAALGGDVYIPRPANGAGMISVGQTFIRVAPPTLAVVRLTSAAANGTATFAGKKIVCNGLVFVGTSVPSGGSSYGVVFERVKFDNCTLIYPPVALVAGQPGAALLDDCSYSGSNFGGCAFIGALTVGIDGSLSRCVFDVSLPSAFFSINVIGALLYGRTGTRFLGTPVRIGPGSLLVTRDLRMRSDQGVVEVLAGATWRPLSLSPSPTGPAIWGTSTGVNAQGALVMWPRAVVDVSVPTDTIATIANANQIFAVDSVTPNTWMPKIVSGAPNPAFAPLSTFTQLNAPPFSGWAKHPFTEALITNGS